MLCTVTPLLLEEGTEQTDAQGYTFRISRKGDIYSADRYCTVRIVVLPGRFCCRVRAWRLPAAAALLRGVLNCTCD